MADAQVSMFSAPVAIGVVDSRWRVRRVSLDIAELLGYEPAECMGAGALMAVHPEDLPELLVSVAHAVASQAGASVPVRLWHKHHGWWPTTVVISPLSPGSPFPFGFVVLSGAPQSAQQLESRLVTLEARMRRIAHEVLAVSDVAPLASPPAPAPADRARLDALSGRQRQIIERLLVGRRVGSIAAELGISASTVRNHLSLVFRKLGVSSQEELMEVMRHPESDRVEHFAYDEVTRRP